LRSIHGKSVPQHYNQTVVLSLIANGVMMETCRFVLILFIETIAQYMLGILVYINKFKKYRNNSEILNRKIIIYNE